MTSFSCLCGSRGGGLVLPVGHCFSLPLLLMTYHDSPWIEGYSQKVSGWFSSLHWSGPLHLYDPFCINITNKNSCLSHLGLLPSPKEDTGISALVSAQALVRHLWVQSLPSTGGWWLGMLSDGRYEAKGSFQYDLMLCFFHLWDQTCW